MTATVKPKVKLGRLVNATLSISLMPSVVPELPDISTGGAYSGQAGQSKYSRFGMFDRTIVDLEMILADGTVRSLSEYPALLGHAASFSGTLGVVTRL